MILFDGARDLIYEHKITAPDDGCAVLTLNAMVQKACTVRGVEFIDMQPVFLEDYLAKGEKFNSDYDYHWNEYGNEVVARKLAEVLKTSLGIKN